jgi:hypothetical protein
VDRIWHWASGILEMQLLLLITVETVISAVDLFVVSVPQPYFLHPG